MTTRSYLHPQHAWCETTLSSFRPPFVGLLTKIDHSYCPNGRSGGALVFEDRDRRLELALPCPPASSLREFLNFPFHIEIGSGVGSARLDLTLCDPATLGEAARLLPRSLCPKQAWPALDALDALERRLTIAPLARCFRRTILDPRLWRDMLTCRSSVNHHHRWPGGNLIHSTERLDFIVRECRRLDADDRESEELGQLAYLLHDFGKLRTVGPGPLRPGFSMAAADTTHAMVLLGPHLEQLWQENQRLGAALIHIFEWLSIPQRERQWDGRYFLCELINHADRFSAQLTAGRGIDALKFSRSTHREQQRSAVSSAANDGSYRQSAGPRPASGDRG